MNEEQERMREANLTALLNDPRASIADLVEVIEQYEGLPERVLDTANSALYGARKRVINLRQAIVLIGFRNLRRLTREHLEAQSEKREEKTEKPKEREMEM